VNSASARAAILAFLCFVTVRVTSMSAFAGDEPHYLVLAQSLLSDNDLKVANNYAKGDYRSYYPGELHPHLTGLDDVRLRRYSQHAPGVAVLIAPAFASGGHWAVVVLVAALVAVGTGFVWQAAYLLTRDAAAAWFGWAAVTLTSPVGLYGLLIYPDPLAGAAIAVSVWALVRSTVNASGASGAWSIRISGAVGVLIAILPWLHTRLAIPAAFLAVIAAARISAPGASDSVPASASASAAVSAATTAVRAPARTTRPRALIALLTPIVVSVAGWLIFFRVTFGSFDPRSQFGGNAPIDAGFIVNGLAGVLFDQEFGLIANAPIHVVALVGLWTLWRRAPRLTFELGLIAVPYAAAACGFVMWWGGYCPPARFLVPVVFPLGVAAALAWSTSSRAGRVIALVLLAASVGIASIMGLVNGGRLVYNHADGSALWIDWLTSNSGVSLSRFLPSFFRGVPPGTPPDAIRWPLIASGLVWTAALGAIFAIAARADWRSDAYQRLRRL
jgi:hypothetical protein